MLEASFRDGLGIHSRKREGEDRKPEARPTPSRREVGGSAYKNKILKIPQTGGSPGIFSARKDENIGQHQQRQTRREPPRSPGTRLILPSNTTW